MDPFIEGCGRLGSDVAGAGPLQRVLLTATAAGLATSFLSQVVEVPQTREELRRLIGGTRPPQAVLRFGHGWPVAATPRRKSADLRGNTCRAPRVDLTGLQPLSRPTSRYPCWQRHVVR